MLWTFFRKSHFENIRKVMNDQDENFGTVFPRQKANEKVSFCLSSVCLRMSVCFFHTINRIKITQTENLRNIAAMSKLNVTKWKQEFICRNGNERSIPNYETKTRHWEKEKRRRFRMEMMTKMVVSRVKWAEEENEASFCVDVAILMQKK